MNILIAEPLAPAGIELFQAEPGWNVIVSNPKQYAGHLAEADALLVRSAVQVTREVLEKAPRLRVIGRAGVGVDNVDLEAATQAGVLVMNTPGGNAISVAEHTLALMLAMARHIPQANASTRAGKWEKKKFMGNELRGKTLGIIGLGSVGREVLKRARAFEMRVIAHDPYVTPKIAADQGVELVELAELYAASDYITLHLAATPGDAGHALARGLRQHEARRAHRQLRARRTGGRSRAAGGARIPARLPARRWTCSPPSRRRPDFRCSRRKPCWPRRTSAVRPKRRRRSWACASPSRWSSTSNRGRHQRRQHALALRRSSIARWGRTSCWPSAWATFAAHIVAGESADRAAGLLRTIADGNTNLLRNAGLAGVLSRSTAKKANLVNALQIADSRGWNVAEHHKSASAIPIPSASSWRRTADVTTVEGAVLLDKPRLTQVDGIFCEAALSGFLIFMKNRDIPGVIGHVGTVLGRTGSTSPTFRWDAAKAPTVAGEPLEAVALVSTDELVPEIGVGPAARESGGRFARSGGVPLSRI